MISTANPLSQRRSVLPSPLSGWIRRVADWMDAPVSICLTGLFLAPIAAVLALNGHIWTQGAVVLSVAFGLSFLFFLLIRLVALRRLRHAHAAGLWTPLHMARASGWVHFWWLACWQAGIACLGLSVSAALGAWFNGSILAAIGLVPLLVLLAVSVVGISMSDGVRWQVAPHVAPDSSRTLDAVFWARRLATTLRLDHQQAARNRQPSLGFGFEATRTVTAPLPTNLMARPGETLGVEMFWRTAFCRMIARAAVLGMILAALIVVAQKPMRDWTALSGSVPSQSTADSSVANAPTNSTDMQRGASGNSSDGGTSATGSDAHQSSSTGEQSPASSTAGSTDPLRSGAGQPDTAQAGESQTPGTANPDPAAPVGGTVETTTTGRDTAPDAPPTEGTAPEPVASPGSGTSAARANPADAAASPERPSAPAAPVSADAGGTGNQDTPEPSASTEQGGAVPGSSIGSNEQPAEQASSPATPAQPPSRPLGLPSPAGQGNATEISAAGQVFAPAGKTASPMVIPPSAPRHTTQPTQHKPVQPRSFRVRQLFQGSTENRP